MMTGSELEPRTDAHTGEYNMYLQYALPGQTLGYAEPMADSWASMVARPTHTGARLRNGITGGC